MGIGKLYLLVQHPAGRRNHPTLQLIAKAVGIDDLPRIDGASEVRYTEIAVRFSTYFCRDHAVRRVVFVAGKAVAAPFTPVPSSFHSVLRPLIGRLVGARTASVVDEDGPAVVVNLGERGAAFSPPPSRAQTWASAPSSPAQTGRAPEGIR